MTPEQHAVYLAIRAEKDAGRRVYYGPALDKYAKTAPTMYDIRRFRHGFNREVRG